jgi:hypothetical protein
MEGMRMIIGDIRDHGQGRMIDIHIVTDQDHVPSQGMMIDMYLAQGRTNDTLGTMTDTTQTPVRDQDHEIEDLTHSTETIDEMTTANLHLIYLPSHLNGIRIRIFHK